MRVTAKARDPSAKRVEQIDPPGGSVNCKVTRGSWGWGEKMLLCVRGLQPPRVIIHWG